MYSIAYIIEECHRRKNARDEPRLTSVNLQRRIQIAIPPPLITFAKRHKPNNQLHRGNPIQYQSSRVSQCLQKDRKPNAKLPSIIINKHSLSLTGRKDQTLHRFRSQAFKSKDTRCRSQSGVC